MPKIKSYYSCEPIVKSNIKTFQHTKCCKNIKCYSATGFQLQPVIKTKLDDLQKYRVCKYVWDKVKNNNINPPVIVDPNLPPRAQRASRREQESEIRHAEVMAQIEERYKWASRSVFEEVEVVDDDEDDDVDDSIQEEKKKVSNREAVVQAILEASPSYYKPFKRLTWRERDRRLNKICHDAINCIIDRRALIAEGLEYLQGNEEVAKDVCFLFDMMKEKIGKWMKLKLHDFENGNIERQDFDEEQLNMVMKRVENRLSNLLPKHEYNKTQRDVNLLSPKCKMKSFYKRTEATNNVINFYYFGCLFLQTEHLKFYCIISLHNQQSLDLEKKRSFQRFYQKRHAFGTTYIRTSRCVTS